MNTRTCIIAIFVMLYRTLQDQQEEKSMTSIYDTSIMWLSFRQFLQAGSLSASWALGPSGLIVNDTLHSFQTRFSVAMWVSISKWVSSLSEKTVCHSWYRKRFPAHITNYTKVQYYIINLPCWSMRSSQRNPMSASGRLCFVLAIKEKTSFAVLSLLDKKALHLDVRIFETSSKKA